MPRILQRTRAAMRPPQRKISGMILQPGIYYDADGNGAGAKVLFAHLDLAGGTVDAPDFIVI